MHILQVTGEFPPNVTGGLGRHVWEISQALVRQGHTVSVLAPGRAGQKEVEEIRGIRIFRSIPVDIFSLSFVTDVLQMNYGLLEKAYLFSEELEDVDLIHAHDWMVAFAAKTLKHSMRIPLIATIHATESGRNKGIHHDLNRYIHSIEWWLTYEAWAVIFCSNYMCWEGEQLFSLPREKVHMIPNGVTPPEMKINTINRRNYAADDEFLLLYVGRLVPEKGVALLLHAFAELKRRGVKIKLVIVGQGPQFNELRSLSQQLGVAASVYFTGYIPDEEVNHLYHIADLAVVPSYYEPFGIVALESMVRGTPTLVADTCGLGEIIDDMVDGRKFLCGFMNSLVDMILWFVHNPGHARELAKKGKEKAYQVYNWDNIAAKTAEVYYSVVKESKKVKWHKPVLPWNSSEKEAMMK